MTFGVVGRAHLRTTFAESRDRTANISIANSGPAFVRALSSRVSRAMSVGKQRCLFSASIRHSFSRKKDNNDDNIQRLTRAGRGKTDRRRGNKPVSHSYVIASAVALRR